MAADGKFQSQKKPQLKKMKAHEKTKDVTNKQNGLVFKKDNTERMANLQRFVDQHSKMQDTSIHKQKQGKQKKTQSSHSHDLQNKKLNLIKDKKRLNILEKGKQFDNHEINGMARLLKLNSRQKKSTSLMRNTFGDYIGGLLEDIENNQTEEDLDSIISDTPKLPTVSKKPNKNERKLVSLPKNVIRVNTKQAFFEQDHVPDNVLENLLAKKKKIKELEDGSIPKRKNKRKIDMTQDYFQNKKRKSIPVAYEFEGLEDEDNTSILTLDATVSSTPSSLKSILAKKKRKNSSRLSVSFDLEKNDTRLIPALKRVSGFTVFDDDDYDCNTSDNIAVDMIITTDELQDISDESDGGLTYFGNKEKSCEDVHMEAEFTDSDSEDSDPQDKIDITDKFQGKKILTEDIYGRLHDSCGNIIDSADFGQELNSVSCNNETLSVGYLNPASRQQNKQLQEQLNSDVMKRVRMQLRGRLNRLAEVNLAGTVTMVTGLYSSHSRHLMNVTLSELLLAELAGDAPTLDRHCQECAVLLAATAANVAEEIGAHILTDFIISWHNGFSGDSVSTSSCRPRNLIMFVCHLYSFGLVHAVLLYDVLRLLVQDLTPANVDQMIQVIGSVGFLLRKDDPQSLRDFILSVQQKSAGLQGTVGAVPQLDMLSAMLKAVKNNNESKMPNYDPSYTEHLRKLLRSFVTGDVKLTPVRVTLEDLLLSETRGRWWVVGSAWTESSMKDATPAAATAINSKKIKGLKLETQFSESFMRLAETMRITRPPKINILFALTVGSQNTDEAFTKLLQMSLPPAQDKIVFDVMLYCIQKMRTYKQFYSLLAVKLCNHDHKYKRQLQHAFWDKLSDIDTLKVKEYKNIAKFVVEIVKSDTLNLSVLKTLPFAETSKKIVSFLEDVFCQLFRDPEGCQVSQEAFEKLFKSRKLQPLRMQFRLFLQVFIVPKIDKGELEPNNALFSKRVRSVIDLLASDQGALL